MESTLVIQCECGNWEEQPSDQQRHHIQNFKHISNLDDGNAIYKCECGKLVTSTIENYDGEPYNEPDPEERYWKGVQCWNERHSDYGEDY